MGVRTRSLTFKQAILIAATALGIGAVLSLFEVGIALNRQFSTVSTLQNDILDLTERGAAQALWSFDDVTAEEILTGIAEMQMINSATIESSDGAQFHIQVERSDAFGPLAQFLGEALFSDLARTERQLIAPTETPSQADSSTSIGRLILTMETASLGEEFITVIVAQLTHNTMLILALSVVLTAVFHRFLTRPLIALGSSIDRIDPKDPARELLVVTGDHHGDELGNAVSSINHMLEQLSEAQERLRHLATRDSMTGLANRALILETLRHAIARSKENNTITAVLFLDLDNFKQVNDTLGHGIGDKLLKAVGTRLEETVNDTDSVGRLGGDEFLIVSEDHIHARSTIYLAEKVLNSLKEPFIIDDYRLHASTSLGLSLCPDDAVDSDTLLRQADTAMFEAKAQGAGCWRFFSNEMTDRAVQRMRTEESLHASIRGRQFILHYQPKVDLRTGIAVGCEALIRKIGADGELIYPGDFIDVAEETGLIVEIGDIVLEEAVQQLARWNIHQPDFTIGVNISARQFQDVGLVDRIRGLLRAYGVKPSNLEVEITETTLMSNLTVLNTVMQELREMGVRVAVDDFGTGYSSLSYLRSLPLDTLKIDRSFVSGVEKDPSIALMILSLAKALNLHTVGEGVETVPELDWLKEHGCDFGQGYHLCRPIPGHDFEQRYIVTESSDKVVSLSDYTPDH